MSDFGDGRFEGFRVALRRHAVDADLANELPSGRLDLAGRGRVVRPA